MAALESLNIVAAVGQWSRSYMVLSACLMACSSAENMLDSVSRVQAFSMFSSGITTAHVVVLGFVDFEPSV